MLPYVQTIKLNQSHAIGNFVSFTGTTYMLRDTHQLLLSTNILS